MKKYFVIAALVINVIGLTLLFALGISVLSIGLIGGGGICLALGELL